MRKTLCRDQFRTLSNIQDGNFPFVNNFFCMNTYKNTINQKIRQSPDTVHQKYLKIVTFSVLIYLLHLRQSLRNEEENKQKGNKYFTICKKLKECSRLIKKQQNINSNSFNYNIFYLENGLIQASNQRREGGGLPCPFLKIGKKFPNLEKKCPDCGHLWVKFII